MFPSAGPPRFMWFQSTQFAETGKKFEFIIFHAGLPMPQVEWTYPPGVKPGNRFHVLYTGVLRIDIVHPTDYGVYNVRLFNKYGMVQTNIGFEVVGKLTAAIHLDCAICRNKNVLNFFTVSGTVNCPSPPDTPRFT